MGFVKNYVTNDEEINNYLRNNPDFFIKHPEALAKLRIPHKTGKNVTSLIEYQVCRLQQQISELEKFRMNLEHKASRDRKLANYVYELSLQLLASDSPGKFFTSLNKSLKVSYAADRLVLMIFSRSPETGNYPGIRFVGPASGLRYMFTEIFHRDKPLCESLQEEHLQVFFNKDTRLIKSTVIIPMRRSDWQGLLVLGSQKQNRYCHGFELDLLAYLGTVCSLVIASWFDSGKSQPADCRIP